MSKQIAIAITALGALLVGSQIISAMQPWATPKMSDIAQSVLLLGIAVRLTFR